MSTSTQSGVPRAGRSDGVPTRWVAVGTSADPDSRAAGAEAATRALAGPNPRLLVVFAGDAHDPGRLLKGIRAVGGATPLVGCSTAGEIATAGPSDATVVVTALGGSGFTVATAAARAASSRLREAGEEAGACLARLEGEPAHRVLLLLSDGLAGDQLEVVRGAYSVAGAGVPLVGGCAGDDLKMARTHQLHAGEVLDDAVVAAAVGSDSPFGIGVQHGWRRVGDAMLVTASTGTRVESIDGRPALDVYLDRLDAPADVRVDPGAFTRFALTHPLGLRKRSGEAVRFVAGADFATRTLNCIAEVPQGGLTWLMEGDSDSVLSATDAACTEALASLQGTPPLGLLAFDCIARRGVLGDDGIRREVDRIAAHGGGAPVAGFYTYGEIARASGTGGFHNQTLVVLAVS